MLEWDPAKRISPEEAKRHPWIVQPEGCGQDHNALRNSAQQHEMKPKCQETKAKCLGHDGQIRAAVGTSDTRISRGPLTEAGNMQMGINLGDKGASKSAVGMLSNMAPHTS